MALGYIIHSYYSFPKILCSSRFPALIASGKFSKKISYIADEFNMYRQTWLKIRYFKVIITG